MYCRKLALGFVGVLLLGCGSTRNNGSPNGSAGTSSAGSSAGTSGAGSPSGGNDAGNGSSGSAKGGQATQGGSAGATGSPVGDTPVEACIAYARAACERHVTCQGLPTRSCEHTIDDCPDKYFSPGSTRTVAGLKACAIVRANQPCEELLVEKTPDCATPGTRQTGEACLYDSQCASLTCSSNGSDCGSCLALAKAGESCAAAGPACEAGFDCDGEKCVVTSLRAPSEPGEPCEARTVCRDGFCSAGKCQALGDVGARCVNPSECKPGLFCDQKAFDCQPAGKAGQPCVEEAGTSRLLCEGGACYVETLPSTGTCGPYPKLGESCIQRIGTESVLALDCAPEAHCGEGAVCRQDLDYGAPTELGIDCKTGLDRICPEGSPNPDVCDDYICGKLGLKGDPCAPAGNPCHEAFECVANQCAPRTTRGLFEKACGNP